MPSSERRTATTWENVAAIYFRTLRSRNNRKATFAVMPEARKSYQRWFADLADQINQGSLDPERFIEWAFFDSRDRLGHLPYPWHLTAPWLFEKYQREISTQQAKPQRLSMFDADYLRCTALSRVPNGQQELVLQLVR